MIDFTQKQKESKLVSFFKHPIGTPEKRTERIAQFQNEIGNHPEIYGLRAILEPGYILRLITYCEPKIRDIPSKRSIQFAGIFTEAIKTAGYYYLVAKPLATKIGEMLA